MGDRIERALRLEYVTVGWNLVEGAAALFAAGSASSVALLAFGLDSLVESASAGILIWRLRAERGGIDAEHRERIETRARRLVAVALFALAAVVLIGAANALRLQTHPDRSFLGVLVLVLAFVVMGFLAGAKRRAASSVGSRALAADAFQTTTCMWLSAVALVGIGLDQAFGWWWADPAASIALLWFIVAEAREAWRGDDCCECD